MHVNYQSVMSPLINTNELKQKYDTIAMQKHQMN